MWNSGSHLGAVLAMGGDVYDRHHSGAATGIWGTEARDVAEHAAVKGQCPAVTGQRAAPPPRILVKNKSSHVLLRLHR